MLKFDASIFVDLADLADLKHRALELS